MVAEAPELTLQDALLHQIVLISFALSSLPTSHKVESEGKFVDDISLAIHTRTHCNGHFLVTEQLPLQTLWGRSDTETPEKIPSDELGRTLFSWQETEKTKSQNDVFRNNGKQS